MNSLRDYINLINEADGVTTTQLTPDQYQAKMAQVNSMRQQQGQAALPVTPSNQIATPSATQATPTTPAPAAPAAAPAAKQWQAGVLGMGSSGPEVSALQKKLGITADGQYGPGTQQAVMALQKKLGVTQDGAYGPITKAAHDKMAPGQGGRTAPPPTDTNKAEKDQPAYTTANDTTAKPATDTGEAGKILKGIENGTVAKDSLKDRTTMATPTGEPLPPGTPSGIGKNATYTADEISAAKQAIADHQSGKAKLGPRDLAFYTGIAGGPAPAPTPAPAPAPAPAQAQTAPVRGIQNSIVTPPPGYEYYDDNGINKLRPIQQSGTNQPSVTPQVPAAPVAAPQTVRQQMAATPAPLTIKQQRQAARAANAQPVPEGMSHSDKLLLDKMLTIAGLR